MCLYGTPSFGVMVAGRSRPVWLALMAMEHVSSTVLMIQAYNKNPKDQGTTSLDLYWFAFHV